MQAKNPSANSTSPEGFGIALSMLEKEREGQILLNIDAQYLL